MMKVKSKTVRIADSLHLRIKTTASKRGEAMEKFVGRLLGYALANMPKP